MIIGYSHNVDLREFICGWGASTLNICIIYPIQKLIFRQILDGIPSRKALNTLRKEGLFFLYRGLLPPLLQKGISMSVMFGMYEEIRKNLMMTGLNIYFVKTASGVLSGTLETCFMPFERIQALLANPVYNTSYRNTFNAFKLVRQQYGVREYFRGYRPVLIRNGPSNAAFFILRDEANSRIIPNMHTPKIFSQFICGSMIGSVISTSIFPLNVIRIAMQKELGGPEKSIRYVLQQLYKERDRNLLLFLKGIEVNFCRSFISWGIINVTYETLKHLLKNVDL